MNETDTILVNYFKQHPFIPTYTIDDEGTIHAGITQVQVEAISEDVKKIFQSHEYGGIIRVGYSGYYNGCRHYPIGKKKGRHLHKDYEYIELGALPKHYYTANGSTPMPKQAMAVPDRFGNNVYRNNPSTPTQGRQLAKPLMRIELETFNRTGTCGIDPTLTDQYNFGNEETGNCNFISWRNHRASFDQPRPRFTYRFGLNLTMSLTRYSPGDYILATWALPVVSGETNLDENGNATTGTRIN